jgi:hypothetical protein
VKRRLLIAVLFIVAALPSAAQILIPAAGSIAGQNGTFFRSDIVIFNDRESVQRVSLRWLPQGVSGVSISPVVVDIGAFSGIISEDFVGNVMHQTGLGAILVTPITQSGTTDPAGRLVITSRIWTPQPGTAGTTSQSLPVIPISQIDNGNAFIFGQRVDSRYRTNVGVVNLDTANEIRFDILQNSDNPTFAPIITPITIPPFAMQQVAIPSSQTTALQIRLIPKSSINPRLWVGYGSSVDNVTGDAWSSLVVNLVVP